MIHMLSRFDLQPDTTIETLRERYEAFAARMMALDLVVSTGPLGRREEHTPMDTDHADAPAYYAIMSFRDRRQLDDAYAYMKHPDQQSEENHRSIHQAIKNSVFTCWRDLD